MLLTTIHFSFSQNNQWRINSWQFQKANSGGEWLPAKVPGTVHTDLLNNGKIPDPFAGCNYKNLGWIDESDWEYVSTFDLPEGFSLNQPVELVFDGIDTYAEVFLNGISVIKTDNMFRQWSVEVNRYLKKKDNILRVVITSALKIVREEKARLPFTIPGEEHAYTRKSPYHYGWDWGPRMVTCGIWKPVYLRQNPDTYIKSVWFKTVRIDNSKARVEVEAEMYTSGRKDVVFKIIDKANQTNFLEGELHIGEGTTSLKKIFTIDKPILWWPNGMGKQHLYRLAISISDSNGIIDEKECRVGIRTVQVVNEKDSIGTSFYFKVNGRAFFAKGANLVPPHSFLPSVNDSTWINLVEQTRQSNINMLRIWGGGSYPPDVFMNACSERGILIWQDFMFACSMYRWDARYLETVKQEAVQQVQRLRKFTCLALWCGNNEIDEAWHNWGWDKMYANQPGVSDSIWKGYKKIFHEILPDAVHKYDTGRFYWPSSPQFGWGRKESMLHGDSHYWGIWWGNEPFEKYKEKIPRFMSEYGYQGSPVMETVRQFSIDGKSVPDSLEMMCHQKHPTGYEVIEGYLKREGFFPKNLEQWVYFSQITQAIGYRTAIEAQRMAMPHCMGSLYWQLNDCWPVVSWSGIDYLGRWKAMQYHVKDLFHPFLISSGIEGGKIFVKAVNEGDQPIEGELRVQIINVTGIIQNEWSTKVSIPLDKSTVLFSETYTLPVEEMDRCILVATLTDQHLEKFSTVSFFSEVGNIKAENPEIATRKDGNTLILTCSKPAFFVQVSGISDYIKADKNYFHMLPGNEYRLHIGDLYIQEVVISSLWNYLK